jgi:hypothetical protein
VLSLLPYRSQLHPLWLALVLVAAQGISLTARKPFTGCNAGHTFFHVAPHARTRHQSRSS